MNTFLWYIGQIPGGLFALLGIVVSFAVYAAVIVGLCFAWDVVETRFDRWINSLNRS